jgi:cytoplasmic iron level regulating protein YaaA (DUF328/UPF0246 family)
MLAILSPAKSLNTDLSVDRSNISTPQFLEQAAELAEMMRGFSPSDLASLMKLSDKLSALNAARFEEWSIDHRADELLPAIYAFNGDVYQGLDVQTLSSDALNRLSDRVRILSGLYGLLRPFDAMRPYRLEMGTKLKGQAISSLPDFWKSRVTDALNEQLKGQPLVNLASNEYSAAVDLKSIEGPVIAPVFKDLKNGEYKIISFYAKRARGLMARFMVESDTQTADDLLGFDYDGYAFSRAYSKPNAPCFIRDPESR